MLVSAIQPNESALSMHISPLPLEPPYPPPNPPRAWAELPVLYNSFPLAICFTRGHVFMCSSLNSSQPIGGGSGGRMGWLKASAFVKASQAIRKCSQLCDPLQERHGRKGGLIKSKTRNRKGYWDVKCVYNELSLNHNWDPDFDYDGELEKVSFQLASLY